jgi:hypothetical protein
MRHYSNTIQGSSPTIKIAKREFHDKIKAQSWSLRIRVKLVVHDVQFFLVNETIVASSAHVLFLIKVQVHWFVEIVSKAKCGKGLGREEFLYWRQQLETGRFVGMSEIKSTVLENSRQSVGQYS